MIDKIMAFVDRHVTRGADTFKLYRVGQGGGEEGAWEVAESGSLEDLASSIEDTARTVTDEASGNGERVKLVIYPYKEDVRGGAFPLPTYEASMTSMVLGKGNMLTPYGGANMNPIDRLIMQTQTHTEHMHRLGVAGLAKALDILQEENSELRAHVRLLEGRSRREAAEREEFATKRHDREMDKKRANAQEDRRDKIMAKVLPLIPAVASKFMGRPDKNGVMGQALTAFGDSLSDEQMDAIYGVLTMEQRIAIGLVLDKKKKDPPKGEGEGGAAPAEADQKKEA